MTAGMTAQKLDGRVSLPRAGLGALLAATLLAGALVGAAIYAGISAAMTQHATVGVTLPRESAVVHDLRIAAGRGQLIGETGTAPITVTLPLESDVVRDLRIAAGRGQLIGESEATVAGATTTTLELTHAPGRGPLR
jgi:hypothetical protein